MNEIERIRDELSRGDGGDPWHGGSVREILEDVTAREASARPIPGGHTIHEIVLHMAAWRGEARSRLLGGKPGQPAEGDWPEAAADDERSWKAALDALAKAHRELLEALARFDEAKLDLPAGLVRDPAEGTGLSYAVVLHGVAQHDAYHAGQIALLKRAVREVRG